MGHKRGYQLCHQIFHITDHWLHDWMAQQIDQQIWHIKLSTKWPTNLAPQTLALQMTLWLQDQMAHQMDNQLCTTKGTTNLGTPNGPQTWWLYGQQNGPPNWDPKWTIISGTLLVGHLECQSWWFLFGGTFCGQFYVPKLLVLLNWPPTQDHQMDH